MIDYSKALFDRHANDFDTLDNKALGVIGKDSRANGLAKQKSFNKLRRVRQQSEDENWLKQ